MAEEVKYLFQNWRRFVFFLIWFTSEKWQFLLRCWALMVRLHGSRESHRISMKFRSGKLHQLIQFSNTQLMLFFIFPLYSVVSYGEELAPNHPGKCSWRMMHACKSIVFVLYQPRRVWWVIVLIGAIAAVLCRLPRCGVPRATHLPRQARAAVSSVRYLLILIYLYIKSISISMNMDMDMYVWRNFFRLKSEDILLRI